MTSLNYKSSRFDQHMDYKNTGPGPGQYIKTNQEGSKKIFRQKLGQLKQKKEWKGQQITPGPGYYLDINFGKEKSHNNVR